MNLLRFPSRAGAGERDVQLAASEPPRATQKGHPYRYAQHRPATLSPERRHAFVTMAPAALWIAGNLDGAKPTDWGDNAGAWPVRLGIMQTWEDRVTSVWNRDNVHERAVICRLWFDTYDAADAVWCAVYARLRHRFTDGKRDWLNFDCETTLGDITGQVLDAAAERRLTALTDEDLLRELDSLLAMARRLSQERD